MSDLVVGKTVGEAQELYRGFQQMMRSRGSVELDEDIYEDAVALEGIVKSVAINWAWWPPWGLERITDDGRAQLQRCVHLDALSGGSIHSRSCRLMGFARTLHLRAARQDECRRDIGERNCDGGCDECCVFWIYSCPPHQSC